MHDILARARDGQLGPFQLLSEQERGLVSALAKQKLLWVDAAGNIRLEPAGYAFLSAKEEELDRLRREAEEKSQRDAEQDASERRAARRSWWQFWLGLLLGWILGGFTARDAFTLIAGLFH